MAAVGQLTDLWMRASLRRRWTTRREQSASARGCDEALRGLEELYAGSLQRAVVAQQLSISWQNQCAWQDSDTRASRRMSE